MAKAKSNKKMAVKSRTAKPKASRKSRTKVSKKGVKSMRALVREATRKRNAAFEKLSPAEKRVAIAHDVLDQLAAKKILAAEGTYFSAQGVSKFGRNTELCEALEGVPCHVCARGAIFVAAVRMADKLKVDDVMSLEPFTRNHERRIHVGSGALKNYNDQFFDQVQSQLIESAFEQAPFDGPLNSSDGEMVRASRMYASESPTVRMKAIMKNIIKNKGEFVVSRSKKKAIKTEVEW